MGTHHVELLLLALLLISSANAIQGESMLGFLGGPGAQVIGVPQGWGFGYGAHAAGSIFAVMKFDDVTKPTWHQHQEGKTSPLPQFSIQIKFLPTLYWNEVVGAEHENTQQPCFLPGIHVVNVPLLLVPNSTRFSFEDFSKMRISNAVKQLYPHTIGSIPSFAGRRGEGNLSPSSKMNFSTAFEGIYTLVAMLCEVSPPYFDSLLSLRSSTEPNEETAGKASPLMSSSTPTTKKEAEALAKLRRVQVYVWLNYTFVNPGGIQSAIQDIPLFQVFLSFAVIGVVLLLGWSGYLIWLRYHKCGEIYHIQHFLTLCLFLTLLKATMSTVENVILRTAGDPASEPISYVRPAVEVISDTCFLAFQLLLSRGYSISVATLTQRDKQILFITITYFIIVRALYAFTSENSSLHEVFQYCTVIGRFVILFLSMVLLDFNIEALRKELVSENDPRTFLMYLRFKGFRMPFIIYCFVLLLNILVKFSVLTWRSKYVYVLLDELATVFYYLLVIVYFRNRVLI